MTRPATWETLVGRAEQRARLTSWLDGSGHTGPALALSGPLGCGKTVLLEATLDTARSAGYQVLTASGAQVEADIGLATLNQVLCAPRNTMSALDRRDHAALAGAFGHGPATAVDPQRLAGALLAALDGPGSRSPALIAVDDVQWADGISAAVLGALARAAIGRRLTVLVAYRSDEPVALDGSGFDVVEVPSLQPQAAATLLARTEPGLAPAVHTRVLQEARGNPVALVELAHAFTPAQRRGQASLPSILPLSRRLTARFGARVLALDPALRSLLLLVALDGGGRLHRIAAARGQTSTELLASPALRDAVSTGLLSPTGNGDDTVLTLGHPLLRATLAALSVADERRQAHRALANAYADDAAVSAAHLAHAAPGPDARLAQRLADLGYAGLDRGDAVGAVATLTRAAELSPDRRDRQRLLAHAACLCVDVIGDLDQAGSLLTEAHGGAAATRRTAPELTAAASLRLIGAGEVDTAHRLLTAAVQALTDEDDPDPRTVAFALRALVEVGKYAGRVELWSRLRATVVAFGSVVPVDVRLLLTALGDPQRAPGAAPVDLDAALAQLDRRRPPEPATVAGMATVALYLDRVDGCAEVVGQLVDQGPTHGAVTSSVNAAAALALHEFHRGHWDRSAGLIDDALGRCCDHGLSLPTTLLRYGRALLAAVGGDGATVELLAADLSAWAAPRAMGTGQQLAGHARAVLALGQGRYAEAHRLLETVGPALATPHDAPHTLWMIYDVVESATRSGHHDEALDHVQALRRLGVADWSSRLAVVVNGAAALTVPAARAEPLFEAALAAPGGTQWRFEHARVRLAYGEHLRRQRRITAARTQLSLALADLRELGAWPWVARACVELRAAGLGLAPAAGATGMLTPQQREIAALAGSGLSNKQIAERMQLSPRTVAAHLRQVFAKLGASTRSTLHDSMRVADPAAVRSGS